MVRKQVYLEALQDARLKRLARATGKTEAELIRDALDRYLPEADDPVAAGLREVGLLVELLRPDPAGVAAAEAAYREALGGQRLGLVEAFLEERRSAGERG